MEQKTGILELYAPYFYYDVDTEAPEELLKVSNVDLNVLNNTRDHRTNKFDVVTTRRELILRRGQVFMIDVEFNRAYDSQKDDLRLVFECGKSIVNIYHTRLSFSRSLF